MAEMKFGKTTEERLMALENYLRTMHADYYGNGNPGFRDEIKAFIQSFRSVESERARVAAERHQENTEKLDTIASKQGQKTLAVQIAAVIISLCAILLTIFGIWHHVSAVDIPTWIEKQMDSKPQSVYAEKEAPKQNTDDRRE